MTPRTVAGLTIHEPHAAGAAAMERPELALAGPVVALPSAGIPAAPDTLRGRPIRHRDQLHRRLLSAADVLAAATGLVLVLSLMGGTNVGPALACVPLVVVLFKVAGLYERDQLRLVRSTLDETPTLVQLTGLYALMVAILAPVLTGTALSAPQIAALWGVGFATTATGRLLARWVAGRVSSVERCLVIGDPERSTRVREKIRSSQARATVVATLPLAAGHVGRWDNPAAIRRIVDDLQLNRIIIVPTMTDDIAIGELIRVAKAAGVQVSVLPRMLDVVGSAVEFDDLDGMTMLGVRPFGLPRSSRVLKRAFDIAATTIGLLAVAPILAAIGLAIRLDSKGSILFRQIRVGRDGRHFHIYKFRSMVVDAEQQKERLREFNEVGDGMFKLTRDPRVTRVGEFLRKTSLDEMPQLLNVLRGEMSLVGPRPLVTDEDAQVLGLDRSRLHLTPGMTGPWQVLGSRVPMQEMVGLDYLYVANWSLWADVKLLLRTVRHVARRGNV
jgi:exopolysaccharide biosynthesis polyprenyl glycosylphosphotransferase